MAAVQPRRTPRYLAPFQLLELNIISAQDLCPVTRAMKTYAVAWIHPERKLSTRVDPHGHAGPTWNDKFVFRVDDEFLYNDTSAVMIEIYATHWWRDVLVGTVRVLIGNLISRPDRWRHQLGMRFVALQVRRPSGRPQGILNIGVGLLDSSMRSMPLYSQLSSSALGYRNLIDEEDPYHRPQDHHQEVTQYVHNYHRHELPSLKPELRRTRSDTSSMIEPKKLPVADSTVSSDYTEVKGKRRGKASSWVSGSTTQFKAKTQGKKKKASSLISGSTAAMENKKTEKIWAPANANPPKGIICKPQLKREPSMKRVTIGDHVILQENVKKIYEPEKFERVVTSSPKMTRELQNGGAIKATKGKQQRSVGKANEVEDKRMRATTPPRYTPLARDLAALYSSPMHKAAETKRKPANEVNFGYHITDSELGPSPSEVVAQIAAKEARMRHHKVVEPANSSVGGWSMDSSVEGLRSKLDRWRTELPPVNDKSEYASFVTSDITAKPKGMHKKSLTDGDEGAFSCFSNICGLQCSIVCGSDSRHVSKKGAKARGRANSRVNDSVINYM